MLGSSGKAICKLKRKLGFVWHQARVRHFFFVADLSKLGHLRAAVGAELQRLLGSQLVV